MIKLILKAVPKFMCKGWIEYLRACSDAIAQKKIGYSILKRKLEKAGYQISTNGTVYPF